MNACLYCEGVHTSQFTFSHFLRGRENGLCELCLRKCLFIKEPYCLLCGRSLLHLSSQFIDHDICKDCAIWKTSSYRGMMTKNRSLLHYNDFMKEWMNRFKFQGDYALLPSFKKEWRSLFYQHFKTCSFIIPIPLSEERHFERGFNQSEALASLLPRQIISPLSRIHTEKQSKKNKQERLQEELFIFSSSRGLNNEEVLLIDDIYTTGATLYKASKVLKQNGAGLISAMTLARS